MAGGFDFAQWYPGRRRRLVASLLVICGDPELAAEAADEAFARTLQAWDRVSTMHLPDGWTYRVAVNITRRVERRRAIERRLWPRLISTSEVVPAPAGEVWDLVRSLPPRQRTAVVLRYVGDLREEDIAAVMGVTRGTVAATLAKARRSLANLLGDIEVEDPS
jgi:RNA polymerase sigma factor (sigma-70 family)